MRSTCQCRVALPFVRGAKESDLSDLNKSALSVLCEVPFGPSGAAGHGGTLIQLLQPPYH